MPKADYFRPSILVLAGLLMASGLAGCDQKKEAASPPPPAAADSSTAPPAENAAATAPADAPLPLATGTATAAAPAPPVAALPPAPRPKIAPPAVPQDSYASVDNAYAMSTAIGDAPPDYGFDYQGVHPWVWRSSNRSTQMVEPVQGGYRTYYYRPGASEPYLVRDPQYSYGYDNGELVTIYDGKGRPLPPAMIDRQADDAGRYLARAAALYQASMDSQRHSVKAANWAARRAALDEERTQWQEQQSQQADWRAYHAQHDAEEQSYWQDEHTRRDQSARSFNDWSSRGYNGPPPPPVPVARDERGRDAGPGAWPPGAPQNAQANGPQQEPRRLKRAQRAAAAAAGQKAPVTTPVTVPGNPPPQANAPHPGQPDAGRPGPARPMPDPRQNGPRQAGQQPPAQGAAPNPGATAQPQPDAGKSHAQLKAESRARKAAARVKAGDKPGNAQQAPDREHGQAPDNGYRRDGAPQQQ